MAPSARNLLLLLLSTLLWSSCSYVFGPDVLEELPCATDQDCQNGQSCQEGLCAAAPSSNNGDPDTQDDEDLPPGDASDEDLPPETCKRNEDCGPGEICDNTQCVPLSAECSEAKPCPEPQNPCTESVECVEGQCQETLRTCDTPPPGTCNADNNLFTTYKLPGNCNPDNGACEYESNDIACSDCDQRCLNSCRDITCEDKNSGCMVGTCLEGPDAACIYSPVPNGIACQLAGAESGLCVDGECLECAGDSDCNDDDPCTINVCNNGFCAYPVGNNGETCNDGDSCTVEDVCDNGTCAGAPMDCSEGEEACTRGECVAGVCDYQPLSEGTSCIIDAQSQTLGACDDAGTCLACATGDSCDDGNPCTDDACTGGSCTHTFNANPCDDGNACTEGDTCAEGTCTPGTPKTCDDNNACTVDACAPATGACIVENNVNDGVACDDGVCNNGTCVECINAASDCPAATDCTSYECTENTCQRIDTDHNTSCGPLLENHCSEGSCVECSDNVSCNPETNNGLAFCIEGTCRECTDNTHCPSANECTITSCVNNVCENTSAAPTTQCTLNGEADAGYCDGDSGDCVECNDDNQCDFRACHTTTCANDTCSYDAVTPGTPCTGGICGEQGLGNMVCRECFVDQDCNNGMLCNNNTCVECITESDCVDPSLDDSCISYLCFNGSCEPRPEEEGAVCEGIRQCDGEGNCVECFEDADCSTLESLECNIHTCNSGECTATPIPNKPCGVSGIENQHQICLDDGECGMCTENTQCDDNNVCTGDSCIETGLCLHDPLDGGPCTTDTGNPGQCNGGRCEFLASCSASADCPDDLLCEEGACVYARSCQPLTENSCNLELDCSTLGGTGGELFQYTCDVCISNEQVCSHDNVPLAEGCESPAPICNDILESCNLLPNNENNENTTNGNHICPANTCPNPVNWVKDLPDLPDGLVCCPIACDE